MAVKGNVNADIPFYVTRPLANGSVAYLSLSLWMQMLVVALAWFNAVGWSIYGLVNLVGNLIEAF